jgi:hypothetical protein
MHVTLMQYEYTEEEDTCMSHSGTTKVKCVIFSSTVTCMYPPPHVLCKARASALARKRAKESAGGVMAGRRDWEGSEGARERGSGDRDT